MRPTQSYILASLALGCVAYYGSEALFWGFPPAKVHFLELAATVMAYALASGCVLSALLLSGARGFAAWMLAGALLGFLIEGVIVSTMYDAFPLQLVWTPLAWHALITTLAVLALPRWLSAKPLAWHVAAMVGLGLFGGLMAAYWPLERADLGGTAQIFSYQLGFAALAMLGQHLLSRLPPLLPPPGWVIWLLPVLASLLWLAQTLADPRPQRAAFPVMVGLTLAAMRRTGHRPGLHFGPAMPLGRNALFLIVPLITASIAAFLVRGSAGFGSNVILAFTLIPAGLALWLWSLWRGFRVTAPLRAFDPMAPDE